MVASQSLSKKTTGSRSTRITTTPPPIGIDQIAEAYERIPASKVRYRFVIDIANTLTE